MARLARLVIVKRKHLLISPTVAFCCWACGGGASPSSPSQPSTNTWTFNADQNSSHFATFVGADGGGLDVWKEPLGATFVQVRTPGAGQTSMAKDGQGRLVYVEDGAGTRLWVNEFVEPTIADVTISTHDGGVWRGLADLGSQALAIPVSNRMATEADIRFVRELLTIYCNSRTTTDISRMLVAACLLNFLPAAATPATPILLACIAPELIDQAKDRLFCTGARAAIDRVATNVSAPITNKPSPRPQPPTVPVNSGPYDGSWRGSGRGLSNFGTAAEVQLSFGIWANQLQGVPLSWRINTPPGTLASTYCGGEGVMGTFSRILVNARRFSFRQLLGSSVQYEITIDATFSSASSANGNITFSRVGGDGPSYCGSATIPWTANKQ